MMPGIFDSVFDGEPDSICGECGLGCWGEPHNHNPIATLTPDAAAAFWHERSEAHKLGLCGCPR